MIAKVLLVVPTLFLFPCGDQKLTSDNRIVDDKAGPVPISQAAVQAAVRQLNGGMEAGLAECQQIRGANLLPPDPCGTKKLGDGFECPTTTQDDLPALPSCSYSFGMKIAVSTAGVSGEANATVVITTESTTNKRARHRHRAQSEIAATCDQDTVTWYMELEQTARASYTVDTSFGPATVNLDLGAQGRRSNLPFCKTEPHGGETLTCGPG